MIVQFVRRVISIIRRERFCRKRYAIAVAFLKEHPQPKLTSEEKKEIDAFWKEYGIKYPDYSWFEMYYGVTGIHDPRFIPDPIMGKICYPYYNFRTHLQGWDDKNVYEKLVPHATFPYSLCHCINGKFYDHKWNYYNRENFQQLADKIFLDLGNDTNIVCKEACNASSGKEVKLIEIRSVGDILDIINNHNSKNYIIQKKVTQHPFFNQFNPTSANIIRIISWRYDGVVNILSASIRYGIEGSFTDIAFVNGKEIVNVVGIDNNGYVKNRFFNLEGNNTDFPRLSERKVPSWDRLLEIVKNAHQDLLFFDFVAWDFMIDDKGNPICIEYNINWPGSILYQYAHGPLAGKYTAQFLDFLKTTPSSTIPFLFRK